MMRRLSVAAAAALLLASGCDSLRDAMSAHSNTAAKAANEDLSVDELGILLGRSQAPLRPEVAGALVDAWVDYHLVARAAAQNDSLNDPALIDEAMWAAIANIKARRWYDQVSANWQVPDSGNAEAIYNNGQILAASHILLLTQGAPNEAKPQIRERADNLRARATAANFAELARADSEDRGSAPQGGSLGAFPRGSMVPEFEQALLALRPGEISPVIETQYGYHIIRRPIFAEVRTQIVEASRASGVQAAESTYIANLARQAELETHEGIAGTVRAVVSNPNSHRGDRTVLATSSAGRFTAADLARWMETFPPQAQIKERLASAPDSMLPLFVRNFAQNELVLRAADSAKLGPDTAQLREIRTFFTSSLLTAWSQLGVEPATLGAAGSSKSDREKAAATKVETHVHQLLAQQAPYVEIPEPLRQALRKKYGYTINQDGVNRALLEAAKVRLASDTASAGQRPPSAVPLPAPDTAGR